jgi:hypothetical protein
MTEKKTEFTPSNDCTDFISQVHGDGADLYAQTDIPTPETLAYLQYLETIGEDGTFNIPSARNKARRLAIMMISNDREGRKENVIALVGHPNQPMAINTYGGATMPSMPVMQQSDQPKKHSWWPFGRNKNKGNPQ